MAMETQTIIMVAAVIMMVMMVMQSTQHKNAHLWWPHSHEWIDGKKTGKLHCGGMAYCQGVKGY
jgi:hypothetical protein